MQCPPTILAIILVEWKLQIPQGIFENPSSVNNWDKLKRVDFLGAIFMSLTIFTALLVLDTGGQKYPFTHPIIIVSSCFAVSGGIVFCLVEKFWAKEPIFPLHLLVHYVVITSYTNLSLANMAQTAVSS